MIRCSRCLYPVSKPDLHFDSEGVCSACTAFENRAQIDWEARHKRLLEILDAAHGQVIVPSSGGKDSTYIALRLKELGADVTAVTATTCHLTPMGRANIDNLARHVRTIEVTPNMTVRKKLNRLALEMVGDISWPEHVSIHRVPFRMARDLGIKTIFFGEAPLMEYGGPPGTAAIETMSQRYVSEFAGMQGLRPQDLVDGPEGLTERDMADYLAPNDHELASHGITAYFLGAFEPWDSRRNASMAKAAGMAQCLPGPMNWWEFGENVDNYQTGAHDFFIWLKYGYGRATAQLSVDIRNKMFSREDALAIVQQRDGLFPFDYMGETLAIVLDRIGVSPQKFIEVCNAFLNRDLFVEDRIEWGQQLTLRAEA